MPHMRLVCVLTALAAVAAAQSQGDLPGVDRVAQVKDYLRGVTENRFDVRCRISFFDSAGKLKKARNETHRLEFTRGSFKGNGLSEATDWSSTIAVTHASRATAGLQTFADFDGLLTPFLLLVLQSNERGAKPQPSSLTDAGLRVAYRSNGECATFESRGTALRHGEKLCGAGEVLFSLGASVPLRTSFEALGLPFQVGKRSVVGYRVEAEFQKAVAAGTDRPLILPKSAMETISFNDGRVVVESVYSLHSGKW